MAATVHTNTTIYPVCSLTPTPLLLSSSSSTISLSSTMLTCKTPPHSVPSEQPVKLTVDSVELHAPVLFTYNQDPIINSIQPSRSFVRSVSVSSELLLCFFTSRSENLQRGG